MPLSRVSALRLPLPLQMSHTDATALAMCLIVWSTEHTQLSLSWNVLLKLLFLTYDWLNVKARQVHVKLEL